MKEEKMICIFCNTYCNAFGLEKMRKNEISKIKKNFITTIYTRLEYWKTA